MIVTGMEKFSESKSKIYIDGEFAFVLYKGDIRKYGLKEGEALSEALFTEITKTLLPKRAKMRAMHLLKSRDYTALGLKRKLKEQLYSEEIIEEAIQYVQSFGYVDDMRYATDYIRLHTGKKGMGRIRRDLLQKGIPSDVLEAAVSRFSEKEDLPDERDVIEALLLKKGFCREGADEKELRKIYGFLQRRGFSQENICHVLFS